MWDFGKVWSWQELGHQDYPNYTDGSLSAGDELIFEEEEEADAEDVDEEVDPDDLIEELEETNEFNDFNDAGEAAATVQPRCSWVYTYRFKECWQRTLTHGNCSFSIFSFPSSHAIMHVEFCSVF